MNKGEKMYLNLKTEMMKMGITIEEIASKLGLTRGTIFNKIEGKTPLTYDEAMAIKDQFFPYADLQWLFKKINRNKEND